MQLRFPLFLVSAIVVVTGAASISDVSAELGTINDQAIGFNKAVKAFPPFGGTTDDFSKIQVHTELAKSTLNATASDVKSLKGQILVFEGQIILIHISDIVQSTLILLETFAAKKPAFELAAFSGIIDIVKQDLKDLRDGASHLGDALISKSPPGFGAQIHQSEYTILNAFDKLIQLYT